MLFDACVQVLKGSSYISAITMPPFKMIDYMANQLGRKNFLLHRERTGRSKDCCQCCGKIGLSDNSHHGAGHIQRNLTFPWKS